MCQCLISYNCFEFSRQNAFWCVRWKAGLSQTGPGGACAPPPVFGRQVNSISTRWECILYPSNTMCPSEFSDLTTALSLWKRALILGNSEDPEHTWFVGGGGEVIMFYEKCWSHWFFRHKDIKLEFLRIVANNLVILLKNVKQIKIRNAVLIEHSYLYLSPTP